MLKLGYPGSLYIELTRPDTPCYTLYNACIVFQSKLNKFCIMLRGNKLFKLVRHALLVRIQVPW